MQIPSHWTSVAAANAGAAVESWAQQDPADEIALPPTHLSLPQKLVEIIEWSSKRTPPKDALRRAGDDPARTSPHSSSGSFETSVEWQPSSTLTADGPGSSNVKNVAPINDKLHSILTRLAALRDRSTKDTGEGGRVLKKARLKLTECISCFEDFPLTQLTRISCTHHYCKACLVSLILTSIKAESSFPPKCCLTGLVPPKTIVKFLDNDQRELYKNKAAEYAIPIDRRRYCPNARCAIWLPPKAITRSATKKCHSCSTQICSLCHGLAHARREQCPRDQGLEAALAFGASNGWRRCHRCQVLVERVAGCRHITCRCGAQFCYICGARWRTCECSEADEVQRQAQLALQRRAIAADEARDRDEERELQRALDAIRALEASETEERARRESEEHEALRRELQQLARLEQERLEEEERLRQEERALEVELKQALEMSARLDAESMLVALEEVVKFQHIGLDDRHGRQERALGEAFENWKNVEQAQLNSIREGIEMSAIRKVEKIREQHRATVQAMFRKQEEQQEGLFMKLQRHLESSSDSEAEQEESVFKEQKKYNLLRAKLEGQIACTKSAMKVEIEMLGWAFDQKTTKAQTRFDRQLKDLVDAASCERKWFAVLSQRRLAMVLKHSRLVSDQLAVGLVPVGLTAEAAALIEPLPPLDPTSQLDDKTRSQRAPFHPTDLDYSHLWHTPDTLPITLTTHTNNPLLPSSTTSSAGSRPSSRRDPRPALTIAPIPTARNGPAFLAAKAGEPSTPPTPIPGQDGAFHSGINGIDAVKQPVRVFRQPLQRFTPGPLKIRDTTISRTNGTIPIPHSVTADAMESSQTTPSLCPRRAPRAGEDVMDLSKARWNGDSGSELGKERATSLTLSVLSDETVGPVKKIDKIEVKQEGGQKARQKGEEEGIGKVSKDNKKRRSMWRSFKREELTEEEIRYRISRLRAGDGC